MKIANPMKKYKTLSNACKAVGFNVEYPNKYKIKEIYVINDELLEIRFSSLIVRKAKYNKDNYSPRGISGVYPGAYPNDCNKAEIEDDSIKGIEYWNGSANKPKAYLAVWDDKKQEYSYSVYSHSGIELKAMSNWQKNFK